MGAVKQMLIELVEQVYPDDYEKQDALQRKLVCGEPMGDDEYRLILRTSVGQNMAQHGLI